MFHTFETTKYSPEQNESNSAAAKRRTSTVRACEPCRRRKIRCNGEHPCETCQWYRKADTCHYTEPRQRQMPSRRSVEKISATLQEYRGILQKLYPTVHPDLLADLPREKLIEMISKTSPMEVPSPMSPILEDKPPPINPDAGSLEAFQPIPEDSNDGFDHRSRGVPGITDDVNALSLSIKQSSSYLGISSVMAVLRVILWLDPESQTFFTKTPDRSALASREHSSPPEGAEAEQISTPRHESFSAMRTDAPSSASSAWDEIPLINAYFSYVHTFIPLIEEQSFRDTYMTSRRSDPRWLLLLNSVLAMGSIAAGTAEDNGHRIYFNRAKQYLTLDSLGAAHLEYVQALAIIGGFYLHYVQQPNLAIAIMGVTLRMATTLGLHREYLDGVATSEKVSVAFGVEMRRRVWWSVFNLDAWAGSTLGRPSMGRMGHAITAKAPQEPITQSAQLLILLQENIRFCSISTRMEDALAISPIIPETELAALDASFVDWFNHSSVQHVNQDANKSSTSGPASSSKQQEAAGLTVTKNVMRWRYLSLRIALHRPILLWYAMRRMPFSALSPEKKAAVTLCREVTNEVITDIASTWKAQKTCGMAGWNATWLLYQAVMVPLLSLFSDARDADVVEAARRQVEVALRTLTELWGWSPTAKRSFEVVSRIYDASKRLSVDSSDTTMLHSGNGNVEYHANVMGGILGHGSMHSNPALRPMNFDTDLGNMNQELFMDNMFDSLNWSTGWSNLDYPFETTPGSGTGWDYSAMNGWGGGLNFEGYLERGYPEADGSQGMGPVGSEQGQHESGNTEGQFSGMETNSSLDGNARSGYQ